MSFLRGLFGDKFYQQNLHKDVYKLAAKGGWLDGKTHGYHHIGEDKQERHVFVQLVKDFTPHARSKDGKKREPVPDAVTLKVDFENVNGAPEGGLKFGFEKGVITTTAQREASGAEGVAGKYAVVFQGKMSQEECEKETPSHIESIKRIIENSKADAKLQPATKVRPAV